MQKSTIKRILATEPERPYISTTKFSRREIEKEISRQLETGELPVPTVFVGSEIISGIEIMRGATFWAELENGDFVKFVWTRSFPRYFWENYSKNA